jgi:hypothetical protein
MDPKTAKMRPGPTVWLCEKHDPHHKHYDLPHDLSGAIADIVALREEVQRLFEKTYDSATELRAENARWRRLFLDKPEDRLWHDSDRTWWARRDDTRYGIGGLFSAEPPGPVKALMEENAKLKAQIAKLRAAKRAGKKVRR